MPLFRRQMQPLPQRGCCHHSLCCGRIKTEFVGKEEGFAGYIAVCDDLAAERERVCAALERYRQHTGAPLRYKVFSSAATLPDEARDERFTLYLLDIMMPGVTGLDAAREIRTFDETAEIVFLTTSPAFAYESYGVHAMDYLLKPVEEERLFAILDKLLARERKPEESLTVKSGAAFFRVAFSRLSYVEVSGKHLHFHMDDGTVQQVYSTLKEYESALLQRREFARIHRSYIVNLLHTASLSSAGVRTFSGEDLPVSRLLYSAVQEQYLRLLFSEREV